MGNEISYQDLSLVLLNSSTLPYALLNRISSEQDENYADDGGAHD